MIYAILQDPIHRPTAYLYEEWQGLHSDLFNPSTELVGCVEFKTHGKTYKERKESARDIARTFQGLDSDFSGAGLSWGEYATIGAYFEEVGKRYGLLKEFKENAII